MAESDGWSTSDVYLAPNAIPEIDSQLTALLNALVRVRSAQAAPPPFATEAGLEAARQLDEVDARARAAGAARLAEAAEAVRHVHQQASRLGEYEAADSQSGSFISGVGDGGA
ncbi:hypothetical protein [Micromonospora echinaurantiaca]|uniref:hypothetical protein n=1 Tax=Micromonospora echinaurantiaca TaxID=47857 RepID=UPI0037B883D8